MVANPLFFADMFFIQCVCNRWQYGYFHPWTLNSRQGPPHDAKHAEIVNSYCYRYTPEVVQFNSNQNRKLNIQFHENTESRYQFRWVTATSPGDVTLLSKSNSLMEIAIDDGDDVSDSIYIEVWLYDTLTGERFMCDPQVQNEPVWSFLQFSLSTELALWLTINTLVK